MDIATLAGVNTMSGIPFAATLRRKASSMSLKPTGDMGRRAIKAHPLQVT
jgi:hypothetical protein